MKHITRYISALHLSFLGKKPRYKQRPTLIHTTIFRKQAKDTIIWSKPDHPIRQPARRLRHLQHSRHSRSPILNQLIPSLFEPRIGIGDGLGAPRLRGPECLCRLMLIVRPIAIS